MTDAFVPALPSRRELLGRIDRLQISADAKVLLAQLATVTVTVGRTIIEAGRRILHFVFETARMFPHIALGVVVGFALWWLVAQVAVLGVVLGPLLGPLLVAFGLGAGAIADVADGGLRSRVDELGGIDIQGSPRV